MMQRAAIEKKTPEKKRQKAIAIPAFSRFNDVSQRRLLFILSFALLSTDIPFYMAFIYCDMNVVDDEIIDFNEHQGSHYFDDEFLRFNSFHGLLFLFMRFES